MASVNKVILVGALGTDPEVRFTESGSAICKLSIATSERWKDKDGQNQERTEWHRVVAFGKTAELCGQYLSKGKQAYIEGSLQTRKYVDKNNVERYTTEIKALSVQFLSPKSEERKPQQARDMGYDMPQEPIGESDIPF